ncbi:MAG: hypothetical protein IKP07_02675 [Bacilli bacterium]|nr:hypothetical protein [Bacilli bacterium]
MFEEYDTLFDEVVKKDKVLSKYEQDLGQKRRYVRNLLLTTPVSEKLRHPIKLFRTRYEAWRIARIEMGYDEIKDTTLVENFVEESGELDHDFYAAATYFKPKRLKLYAAKYPIYRKQDDKLLQRKR